MRFCIEDPIVRGLWLSGTPGADQFKHEIDDIECKLCGSTYFAYTYEHEGTSMKPVKINKTGRNVHYKRMFEM